MSQPGAGSLIIFRSASFHFGTENKQDGPALFNPGRNSSQFISNWYCSTEDLAARKRPF